MNRKKALLLLFVIVAACATYFVVDFVIAAGKMTYSMAATPAQKAGKSEIYLDLIDEQFRDSLTADFTLFGHYRQAIGQFEYDSGHYRILIWEYLPKDPSLPLTIKNSKISNRIADGQVYQGIGNAAFDIMVTEDSLSRTNNLFLNIEGNSIQKRKISQNILYYRSFLENLSFSNEEGGAEIWNIESNLRSDRLFEMAFLQRENRSYIVFMIPQRLSGSNEEKLPRLLGY